MIGRALLIANPASRRGSARLERCRAAFAAAGVSCDLRVTEYPGHAGELAAAHGREYDAVFSLGGDGTVMEVAGAMAGTGVPVGVLAGGTGNLLARALAIPLDVERAVPALLEGGVVAIDQGRFADGRRFEIAAGLGIDVDLLDAPPALKRRLGIMAYTLIGTRAALRRIFGNRRIDARITVDGVTESFRATTILIANFGTLVSGWITLGPGVRPDDGAIDVIVLTATSVWDGVRIMWRLVTRDFTPHPTMAFRRGSRIRIETDPPQEAQADGELIGTTPIDITVDPGCARFLVPAGSPMLRSSNTLSA